MPAAATGGRTTQACRCPRKKVRPGVGPPSPFPPISLPLVSRYIPHVQILGMNHCGDSRQTVLKRREEFQDALRCRYYYERVVAIFPTKYNQNIMAEIDPCLLRLLHWNISVHYHRHK